MTQAAEQMTESEFVHLADGMYKRIERAFDDVDPDLVECEVGHGTLTFLLPGGKRWILSRQPPVRQLWLAVATRGQAFHFDYDATGDAWRDDKGQGLELLSYLAQLLQEETGVTVRF